MKHLRQHFFIAFFVALSTCWTSAQFSAIVNSTADDEAAHPWDNENTDQDETMDGICEDHAGRCTLRAALEEAFLMNTYADIEINLNGTIQLDATQFSFSVPDHSIITATEGMHPTISGAPGMPIFVIDNGVSMYGLELTNSLHGIVLTGRNNKIGSVTENKNYIHSMEDSGIFIVGDSNHVFGNVIGLDRHGFPFPNKFGMFIIGAENTIGGSLPDQGNVIAGNQQGLAMHTIGGNCYIRGNYIGTDESNSLTIGNQIGINVLCPFITIGGQSIADGNVISGNAVTGILIGLQAIGVSILNNHIGTDKSDYWKIPNETGIILGPGSSEALVANNKITGNSITGLAINGNPEPLSSNDHRISGNEIIGNGNGIVISGNAHRNIIGSSLTMDSGPNIIHQNEGNGIFITSLLGGSPDDNTFRKNKFSNSHVNGIEMTLSCQDALQPPDSLEYKDYGLGYAIISGKSVPGATIDIYTASTTGSGTHEGNRWVGKGIAGGGGYFVFPVPVCFCQKIVATATNTDGSTSRFSASAKAKKYYDLDELSPLDLSAPPAPPFWDGNTISFRVSQEEQVDLVICDISGQVIETLVHEVLPPDDYTRIWNASAYPSGIYFYRWSTGSGYVFTGKMVLIQ